MTSRSSSQSGTNGHNSFTSADESSLAAASGCGGEIMLFGVRVKVDPMRKSVSLNNLSQYELPNANENISNNSNGGNNNESSKVADEGYASADDAVPHHPGSGRERKRGVVHLLSSLWISTSIDFDQVGYLLDFILGVPWTEEEHKLFLLGLQKVGKGDWRGISRNFVKTRTPTQVASHAQKYFLRRTNLNRRRRRSSLFDITTDSVSVMPIEEKKNLQEHQVLAPTSLPPVENSKINAFQVMTPLPVTFGQGDQISKSSSIFHRPIPVLPLSNWLRIADLNLNRSSAMEASSLSLTLSLSQDHSVSQSSSTRHSAFQVMSNFNNGESIISVA